MTPATWVDVSHAGTDWLVRTSWQAGVLIAGVLLLQLLLGHKRLRPRWAYALWMLVVVRLLMPVVPASPWSVFNLKLNLPQNHPAHAPVATTADSATPVALKQPTGVRVSVGIIEGPERRVTASSIVTAPKLDPAPAAPIAPRPGFDWRQLVSIVWLSGATIALARVLIGIVILRRGLRRADAPDAHTMNLLNRCRDDVGTTAPRVLVTDAVSAPALFGFFRPRLLLPPSLLMDLSHDELRFVLLHELAHVRRLDPLTNGLLVLVSCVHWFNPLARFAMSRCRAERELACDELVMRCTDSGSSVTESTPPPPHAYGEAVLRVAQALRPSRRACRVPVAAVGMIHTRSQLRRRIAMIATYTPDAAAGRSSRFPRAAMSVLLVLLVASCALTDGATKPPAKSSTQPDRAAAPEAATQAAHADPEKPQPADPQTGESEKAMQAMLDRTIPEVPFDNVPFSDTIDFLRDVTTANIFVNWNALQAAGIDKNTPVATKLHNVKFSKALQTILDTVGGGTVKLGYAIDGNVLNISTEEELSKYTVTRVYDIRDLLVEIPDFDNPRNTTAAPAPAPAPQTRPIDPATRRADHIKRITDLIQETVQTDSWRENGGTVGTIRELDGQLIVTQTESNHRELATFLEQLREPRSLQVTVETRFLTLDPANLDESLRQKLAPSFEARTGKPGVSFLTDDDVQALIRASNQSKQSTVVTAPRLTLFSGQRAYVSVQTQRAYVSSFSLEQEHDGKQRWEPKISVTEAGLNVDVSATVSADRKYVVLTLRPELTRLVALRDEPFKGPPDAPKDLFVQVPQITAQRLQTSASVPDRQTLLLGGVVADVDATGQPATRPTGNLYILVKPTLIAQREIAAK